MSSIFIKKYYSDEKYKEKHNEYMKQYIQCECGLQIRRHNTSHHKKSKIHQSNMDKQKLEKPV